jgi:hypothetical protein
VREPRVAPRRGVSGAVLLTIASALAVAVTAGCTPSPVFLDAPYPLNLHVDPRATVVKVDASGWYADSTDVFLCPTEPPPLPDPGPARSGWTPGHVCHDYGRHASPDGFTIDLQLDDLTGAERAAFAASPDWYLVLTDLDGDRATGAARSRFPRPDGFTDS